MLLFTAISKPDEIEMPVIGWFLLYYMYYDRA